jgi:phosphoenolpyruvate phosphomutase
VTVQGISIIDNERHAETGELYSLARAGDRLDGETILVYGDVLFRQYILDELMAVKGDIVLAVDALKLFEQSGQQYRDLVAADRPFSGLYLDEEPVYLRAMAPDLPKDKISGEWMGLARLSGQGAEWMREEIAAMTAEGLVEGGDLPLLFNRLTAKHPVSVHYFTGHWLDVDTVQDLANARNFT